MNTQPLSLKDNRPGIFRSAISGYGSSVMLFPSGASLRFVLMRGTTEWVSVGSGEVTDKIWACCACIQSEMCHLSLSCACHCQALLFLILFLCFDFKILSSWNQNQPSLLIGIVAPWTCLCHYIQYVQKYSVITWLIWVRSWRNKIQELS